MRIVFGLIVLSFVLGSCGSGTHPGDGTVQSTEVVESTDAGSNRLAIVREGLQHDLKPLAIPSWIMFDSIPAMKVPVKAEDAALLFPKDFGIPPEVAVFAFATHPIDSVSDGIWFYMELISGDGPPNKDVWMVLYDRKSGPTAAHCFATSGVGYGYAKIDSVNAIREVLIEKMEDIHVTTGTVTIGNGSFRKDNETHKKFGSDPASSEASNKYVAEFLK